MADDFVHLHVHSEYSLLDGLGRIKNLVKEAKRLGQPALALTDHGVMHGAIEFFRACKEQGVRPLIGVEGYQTTYGRPMGGRDPQLDKENYHLLMLARNMTGYRNLLKIASHAQLNGYYYKPRVDHEFLARHAEGLFCTTGCLGAEVPQLLYQGKEKEAYERLGWYVDVFGRENFAIELQEHSIPELVTVNKTLVPWAEKFGLQLVATNDVHYVREEDGTPHDVLLCVQTGVQISQQNRMRMSDASYFLKSREQMEATFRPFIDLPSSAFDHTLRIAEMCEVDLEDPTYHLPDLPIPEGFNYETYLRHLTEEGVRRLYGERANDSEVVERKERELKTIHEMGFDIYYLIVADLCDFARSRNIWWNVRGSGAGSLVAYAVGITGIDPLKNNLIFERFLNPGRVTMPDFDLDYPDDQREEMIRYTVEKFGESQVAQIATFNRMKAKAAVRDVGRAQGIELSLVDKIAKLIPGIPGKPVTIQDCLTEGHEFHSPELVELYRKEQWVKELLETAMKLEGVARNAGIHAAAVIVADRELEHYTPLMRGSKSTVTSTIAQYEFPILESIGLLKVDFLGLSTLSVMREAARLIKERRGIEYRLDNIPYEGEEAKEAFTLLSSGEVSGVFQVESAGMRRTLIEMKPTTFEHIVAMISLYRPGPMEYIPTFIQRLHGREQVEFKHPKLEPILNETYGICVSGDSLVMDARTGRRYRLDEVGGIDDLLIQGVDAEWRPAAGRVTHWIDSGIKPVYRLQLRNGMHIKVTADHRLLTEDGWVALQDLHPGDFVAVPRKLFGGQDTGKAQTDWRKLRVLAYLIADGSLGSMASVDFTSKDPSLLAEYEQCFVPPFVFELGEAEITYFLASLWDCDGYMGAKLCHYKTISSRLAEDVQTLLLRVGIRSVIHTAEYTTTRKSEPGVLRTSYQVTVYDTARLAELLQPYMVTVKREIYCAAHSASTIRRAPFISEALSTTGVSALQLMKTYGIDRQHFYKVRQSSLRISSAIAGGLAAQIPLPNTERSLHVDWEEVVAIEAAGDEHVYDLTVEGLHSFVANNIIVHNCVYQEQIIQILSALAGYTPGEADLVRRAIGKKKASEIEKHKKIFIAGCERNGIDGTLAGDIYADIEFFARYGFNKCLPGDVEIVDAATGRMVRIEDLYHNPHLLQSTVTCDTATLELRAGAVSAVMDNGVKPVYRLTTALGRQIEATANHPFYTFDGWRLLEELQVGEQIATPRQVPVEGRNEWPDYQVIALGHLLAEGNLCHPHSVYFYSKDSEQRDDFVQAAEQFENVACTTGVHRGVFSIYARRQDRALEPGIVTWAKQLGIWGENALHKHVPAEVFTLTNRQLGLLISRMWEGDGHIDQTGRSLFYATSSQRLAQQLQHLLLRLGIISRLRTVEFPYKEGRIGYQLFVTGSENIALFRQHVACHFVSAVRRRLLDQLVVNGPEHTTSKDVIPLGIKDLVRAEKQAAGVSWREINEQCGVAQREFYPTGAAAKHGFARHTIRRLAGYFHSDQLQRYADSEIYWDRVVSIEYVGEKRTYDLEVPGTHNFVANDILVHNSHAADYAVITVQTAYLKAHYPVEYMAAQLLVERDKTEKVINFVSECRRMGVDVLPPDVNYSGLDFDIQVRPPETVQMAHRDPSLGYPFPVAEGSAIRFGMAAIKNVGEGPVEAILAARNEGGPFTGLEDFCDRVDLRKVGKRPLEFLIKAGALDRFGFRSQLLAVLDQMVAQSTSVHDARDAGQLSMFDLMGGSGDAHVTPIKLPNLEEVKGKEKLTWEKELLGVYSISHPMLQLDVDLKKVTSCSCAELDERFDGKGVTLAGLIAGIRTINTKKGDQMAFVQLEDLQGGCEVVFFPKTYAECKDKLVADSVVIVKGKAQTREGQTSLLAELVLTHFDKIVTIGDDADRYQPPLTLAAPTLNGLVLDNAADYESDLENGAGDEPVNGHSNGHANSLVNGQVNSQVNGHVNGQKDVRGNGTVNGTVLMSADGWDDFGAGGGYEPYYGAEEENPFRNDLPGWLDDGSRPAPLVVETPSPAVAAMLDADGVDADTDSDTDTDTDTDTEAYAGSADAQQETPGVEGGAAVPIVAISAVAPMMNGQPQQTLPDGEPPAPEPQSAPQPPAPAAKPSDSQPPAAATTPGPLPAQGPVAAATPDPVPTPPGASTRRRLVITFRRTGDLDRDKYRLREIYEMVRDPRGRDSFTIRIENNGQAAELAFPNDTCTITKRLETDLKRLKLEVAVVEL